MAFFIVATTLDFFAICSVVHCTPGCSSLDSRLRFCLSVFVRGAPISGVSIGPIRGAPVGPFRGSPMGLFQRPHLDKLFLVSATGSTNATACMYIAGFTGAKGGPCAACPAGKYKTATGSVLCTVCGSGKYYDTVAANISTICNNCPMLSDSAAASWICKYQFFGAGMLV